MKAYHKILIVFCAGLALFGSYWTWIFLSLPKLVEVKDYQPPLLTQVYDRNGNKAGEFFKERRLICPYKDIPKFAIWAFVSAEDGSFFTHKGLNYKAIARAFLANLKAGKKVQGGSTITQQLARTLLLSTKKTYTRKIKEALLALRMENSLSKQDILYIYLNQIYFGHGAYGLEMASRTYFRKPAKKLNLAEAALLAGLPKAPSRFSPVFHPERAKNRQIYVLNRMLKEGYINEEEMSKHIQKDITVFVRKNFSEYAPYYLETVRRILLLYMEAEDLVSAGLKIRTAMDLEKQKIAQKALRKGLEDLDKRQGFRGAQTHLANEEERQAWTEKRDKSLKSKIKDRLVLPGLELTLKEGEEEIPEEFFQQFKERFKKLEGEQNSKKFWFQRKDKLAGKRFPALISKVDKQQIEVLTPWGREMVALEDFSWAVPVEKKPDKPSLSNAKDIFKVNDVALFRIKEREKGQPSSSTNIPLELYQEPLAEGALLSFDLSNAEIIALVGGYDYNRSQYNRAYQARRQSGSVFKPFVYGAALERGFRPDSLISDSPVVFSKQEAEEKKPGPEKEEANLLKNAWRPANITDRFLGDILFRKALIRSLNVPTVRIMEKIGLSWLKFYTRRLGVFSPLNADFTMALGSSSLNLYETLKAFSVIANQGQALVPLLTLQVEDSSGKEILSHLSLNEFFKEEIDQADSFIHKEKIKWFKESMPENQQSAFQKRWMPLLHKDSKQLIPPSNSYVLMSLLSAVIQDPEGTGRKALVLNRPLGGKTGTTDGYYDTWFVGASPFISTAVWIGHDSEKTLGKGETGSRAALPVWVEYMEKSHEALPRQEFPVPEQVVFANIDAEKGGLVSSSSKRIVHQAFIEGNMPEEQRSEGSPSHSTQEDEADFIREDLSR